MKLCITVALLLSTIGCHSSSHLSVSQSTYEQQMQDCLRDISWFNERLKSGNLTRDDTAVFDGHDAALLRSVTCASMAAEPLSSEARSVIEKAGEMHIEMVQYMRYNKRTAKPPMGQFTAADLDPVPEKK